MTCQRCPYSSLPKPVKQGGGRTPALAQRDSRQHLVHGGRAEAQDVAEGVQEAPEHEHLRPSSSPSPAGKAGSRRTLGGGKGGGCGAGGRTAPSVSILHAWYTLLSPSSAHIQCVYALSGWCCWVQVAPEVEQHAETAHQCHVRCDLLTACKVGQSWAQTRPLAA